MKKENKPNGHAAPVRRTYKTKDDFLRWLREQELLKKQAAEKEGARDTAGNTLVL
jgi:hypothetical protein